MFLDVCMGGCACMCVIEKAKLFLLIVFTAIVFSYAVRI